MRTGNFLEIFKMLPEFLWKVDFSLKKISFQEKINKNTWSFIEDFLVYHRK